MSRELKKIEGQEFTPRVQKNSQDSVKITDEATLPMGYRKVDVRIDGVLWETVISYLPDELADTLEASVQEIRPDADAIKAASMNQEQAPGAEVRSGSHLRVA